MWACDPCDDCGEALEYDPTVKMVFINQDSATILQDSIDNNEDSIDIDEDLYDDIIDYLDSLYDEILKLDTLIDEGQTEYQSQKDELQNLYDSLDDFSEQLDTNIDSLESINSDLDDIIDVIESGKLLLDKAVIVDNNSTITYEDSAKTFKLPLLLPDNEGESGETNYEITIAGTVYTIGFSYTSEQTMDKTRTVKLQAIGLDTLYHSFDSLHIKCPTDECISDATTITVYF